jgi:hypothetical protein
MGQEVMGDPSVALAGYLDAVRDKPFEWGIHDCMIFTNACVKAQTGSGFADDWASGYKTIRQCLVHHIIKLREVGARDIVEAIDKRLPRSAYKFAPRGSIVAMPAPESFTGYALGVVVSHRAAFVGPDGLSFVTLSGDDIAWEVI